MVGSGGAKPEAALIYAALQIMVNDMESDDVAPVGVKALQEIVWQAIEADTTPAKAPHPMDDVWQGDR